MARWRGRRDVERSDGESAGGKRKSRKRRERGEERGGRRHKFRASVKRALRGEALAPPICQYPEEIRGGTWPEG